MAIFELTGPDGAVYEVEAPNEQAALAAFRQMIPQASQPADPRNPDGTYGQPPEGFVYNPETGQMEDLRSPINPNIPTGAANALALGTGQGVGFNLLDEAVAGASTLFGGDYDYNLARMREAERRAQSEHPVAYYGGTIGGAATTGMGLSAGGASLATNAINAGANLPKVAAASGLDGAVMGALYGFGGGEGVDDRLSDAATGSAWGFGLGASMPAVTAGLSKAFGKVRNPFPASKERAAAADLLRNEGIPVTAGQKSGNRVLRTVESEIGPRDIFSKQQDAFTSAVLRRAGIAGDRATPEILDNAFNAIGKQFDDLAANSTLVPDGQMVQDLRAVFGNYVNIVPESMRSPIVQNVTQDIVEAARRGPISGEVYQNITSRIARAARGASNPDLRQTLYGLREALDDAMERSLGASNPSAAGAWRAAREQYRNLLAIEQAATRAGEAAAEGIISPANLRNAVVNQGRRAYARGQGDFADLARAGSMLLNHPPDSGTAIRTAVRNIGIPTGAASAGALVAGLPGAAAGVATPWLLGRALMSGPVQGYLSKEAATKAANPIREAIINAMLTGNTSMLGPRLPAP